MNDVIESGGYSVLQLMNDGKWENLIPFIDRFDFSGCEPPLDGSRYMLDDMWAQTKVYIRTIPMSRKRFKKLLMSTRMGRDDAEWIARAVNNGKMRYSEAWLALIMSGDLWLNVAERGE